MSSHHSTAQAHAPQDDNQARKILIVEDNLMNRRLAGFLVKNNGLEHDACASGEEALLLLRNNKYLLILMDIEMPGMNGYECTRKLRSDLKIKTPVIALTAHDSEEERKNCEDSGMNGYLTKPVDEAEFQKTISRYLH